MDLALDYEGFHPTVLVYFRDRLEEQKAERMIFDGIVKLLVELGLVKRKGKQRLDSTHIIGYVKAMSWLECAMERLRLGIEDLKAEVGRKKRPEFWQRLWVSYVQSQLDWRLSKTEHASRYRQCGQDISELLEWLDRNDSKLREPHKGAYKGAYNTDGFHIDIDKRQAVCPQGNLSSQCSRIKDNYQGTEYYRMEWASQCDRCPVQKQCAHSNSGRRPLVVGLRHDLVEKRRQERRQAGFSKRMHRRNGIEGTHSELVRGQGLRRTKYRGLSRVGLSHYFMGAAGNVKR